MEQQGLNLIEIIHKGALATYPLILLSVISVTVVFERLWSLRNIRSTTLRIAESLIDPVQKGQRDLALAICKQNSHCPAGRIFHSVIERAESNRPETASNVAVEAMFEETQHLRKHLWILGTVASSAPPLSEICRNCRREVLMRAYSNTVPCGASLRPARREFGWPLALDQETACSRGTP